MQSPKLNNIPVSEYPYEGGMGEAQHVSLTSDLKAKLFAVFINILVVGELFVAMYVAHQTPSQLTPAFFKIFLAMLLPTLALAYIGRRTLAKAKR